MTELAVKPVAYSQAASRGNWKVRSHRKHADPVAFIDFRKPGRTNRSEALAWPEEPAAFDYAKASLIRLAVDHREAGLVAPDAAAEHRMLRVLRSVLASDSIYPTMSVEDDGSIIAEWRIAQLGVEVIADVDGSTSFAFREEGKRVGGGVSATPLRRILRDLTAVVERANPNWRSLFVDANPHGL